MYTVNIIHLFLVIIVVFRVSSLPYHTGRSNTSAWVMWCPVARRAEI